MKQIGCICLLLLVLASCGTSKSVQSKKKKATTTTRTVNRTTPKTQTKTPSNTTSTSTKNSESETLQATTKVTVTTEIVKEYISTYKETAKDNMRNHGIPASITLAQGILESGSGYSALSVQANNHFGIKCHTGWTGPSIRHDDDEAQECFRKYAHPSESYRDHSLFLTSRSRYNSLFSLPKDDYVAWAKGLKAAGYATDPKYPDKLIGLIERYELYQYDAQVLGGPAVSKTRIPIPADGSVYEVQQGDTLYSISRKFNLSVEEIMRLNKLSSNTLSIGQQLKVK